MSIGQEKIMFINADLSGGGGGSANSDNCGQVVKNGQKFRTSLAPINLYIIYMCMGIGHKGGRHEGGTVLNYFLILVIVILIYIVKKPENHFKNQ